VNGAKNNFRKVLVSKGSVRDGPNDLPVLLDNHHRFVLYVVNQPRNVLFGHLGQLLLEDILGSREKLHILATAVVANHPELDESLRLLLCCELPLSRLIC